jgi:putative phosphoribosyl transferase
VEVGFIMSTQLNLPLEVFISRKLRYPGNPEYAMGAITETGLTWLNEDICDMTGKKEAGLQKVLDEEIARQQGEIERQKSLYRPKGTLRPLNGYTVILVDDGIATGSTFMASIYSLRTLGITRLIGAIPLGPVDTIKRIRLLVDHLEVLYIPDAFVAVGAHYARFPQVEDQQVIQLLRTAQNQFSDHAPHSCTG